MQVIYTHKYIHFTRQGNKIFIRMKAYFISGLAADSRVFTHIQLPEGFDMQYIEWITPLKNEGLRAYAQRLARQIESDKPFALVGLSMGGMLATEIAKTLNPSVTILLSSVPLNAQLPGIFKLAYKIRLHKLVPVSLLKSLSVLKRDFIPDSPEDKVLLKQIIKDSDSQFIRWAIQAILQWKNEELPPNYWHIHGSKDELLPLKNTQPTHIIQGGNHLMIMSKAEELNAILAQILQKYRDN